MLLKVYGGTVTHDGETLCAHCRFSRIVRGQRLEEELVFCDAPSLNAVRITFKVTSCTNFVDEREPTYHELLDKAWILRPRTKGRAAGFVRASELRPDEAMRVLANMREGE